MKILRLGLRLVVGRRLQVATKFVVTLGVLGYVSQEFISIIA